MMLRTLYYRVQIRVHAPEILMCRHVFARRRADLIIHACACAREEKGEGEESGYVR